MAIVTAISKSEKNFRSRHPSETTCEYLIGEQAGQRFLQLNTVGSEERKVKGQTSQTMQFDEQAAADLFDLLKREFGFN